MERENHPPHSPPDQLASLTGLLMDIQRQDTEIPDTLLKSMAKLSEKLRQLMNSTGERQEGKSAMDTLAKEMPKDLSSLVQEYLNAKSSVNRHPYTENVKLFHSWCSQNHITTADNLNPELISRYLEYERNAKVKGTTAVFKAQAVRNFCEWLIHQRILQTNPVPVFPRSIERNFESRVENMFSLKEIQTLFTNCNKSLVELRDRAMIGVIFYTLAPKSTVRLLRVKDYFHEEGEKTLCMNRQGKERLITLHPKAALFLEEFLQAAGIAELPDYPLFPRLNRARKIPPTRQTLGKDGEISSFKTLEKKFNISHSISENRLRLTGGIALLQNEPSAFAATKKGLWIESRSRFDDYKAMSLLCDEDLSQLIDERGPLGAVAEELGLFEVYKKQE